MPISEYLRHLRERVGNELVVMPAVAVTVLDARQRLLLVRDAAMELWALPGGALDPDEAPADAAVREIWEETAVMIEPRRVGGFYGGPDFRLTYPNGDVVSYCVIVFTAEITGGIPLPDGDEVTELGWFSQSEAAALPMGPGTRVMIDDAFGACSEARFARSIWRPRESPVLMHIASGSAPSASPTCRDAAELGAWGDRTDRT